MEIPWSKSASGQRMYILTCDNLKCPCYRNPVKVRHGTGTDDKCMREKMKKLTGADRGSKDTMQVL
jgi:hypothetical protein